MWWQHASSRERNWASTIMRAVWASEMRTTPQEKTDHDRHLHSDCSCGSTSSVEYSTRRTSKVTRKQHPPRDVAANIWGNMVRSYDLKARPCNESPVLVPRPLPQAPLGPEADSLHHRAVSFQRQHPRLEVGVATNDFTHPTRKQNVKTVFASSAAPYALSTFDPPPPPQRNIYIYIYTCVCS